MKKQIQAMKAERTGILASRRDVEHQVNSLKVILDKKDALLEKKDLELEEERALCQADIEELTNGASQLVKEQVAHTKLVMMKQYKSGAHASWKVDEQIAQSIVDLGDKAEEVLKSLKATKEDEGEASASEDGVHGMEDGGD